MRTLVIFLAAAAALAAQPRKLLVISVDGMDHRYLKNRDALGLRIPNLRRLIREGSLSQGMVGVVPTVTWPSHTTMITGVRSDEHGILSNRFRTADGSDYYWYTKYLKAPTLWQAMGRAGRTTAAITWPVTVGDGITYNLPEFFRRRNGGGMDLHSIEEKATPGLVAAIAKEHPSFPTEWMDDRARAIATAYILKKHAPDLTLLHFVDLDAAAHENGPFTREANAILEYTDELIGMILTARPADTVVAVVSDHGFELVEKDLDVTAFLAQRKLPLEGASILGGVLTTSHAGAAAAFREAGRDKATCVGREIPETELRRFLPAIPAGTAAFEPAPGCWFGRGAAQGGEKGRHGHWPTRYRASFLLWGPGIQPGEMPELDMRDAVRRFAKILGVEWPD